MNKSVNTRDTYMDPLTILLYLNCFLEGRLVPDNKLEPQSEAKIKANMPITISYKLLPDGKQKKRKNKTKQKPIPLLSLF